MKPYKPCYKFAETGQMCEPGLDAAGIFKTMMNMLRASVIKVDTLQGQMNNVCREMEILKKNRKKC
jgi:hypothetical protein